MYPTEYDMYLCTVHNVDNLRQKLESRSSAKAPTISQKETSTTLLLETSEYVDMRIRIACSSMSSLSSAPFPVAH